MGQSNTGVTVCKVTYIRPRYTSQKIQKRETLTLKKSLKQKLQKGQGHFEATADFTGSGQVDHRQSQDNGNKKEVLHNDIPVLTAAVLPAPAVNSTLENAFDNIPVLNDPVSTEPASIKGKTNLNYLMPSLLLAAAVLLAILMWGSLTVEESTGEAINTAAPAFNSLAQDNLPLDTESLTKSETSSAGLLNSNNTTGTQLPANAAEPASNSDSTLVHNLVQLINKEKFAKDETIEALLSVWQQTSPATRASLNSTPWFLKFVFTLQKQAKIYLQSPGSYHADYSIKISSLLKLAIALGVLDERGIQSNIELYSSKQNKLLTTLKTEIARIEQSNKSQPIKNETIEGLNKKFRQQYAAKEQPAQVKSSKAVTVSKKPQPVSEPDALQQLAQQALMTQSETINAIELDKLVTRFTAAYEHGDLKMLASLFAKDAKTNDKSSLHGIREDYQQLFETSSFRILNIMNMRWDEDHQAMKGTGDYEIAIAMADSGNARTLHGKIQFVIGKVDEQLRIKRLYHLER